MREQRFERLGVFPYSEEEGTFSAEKLSDNVPERVKNYRAEEIMRIQSEISLNKNAERIGRVERVIVDERRGEFYIARSQYDSPEVDEEIYIEASGKRLFRGRFYDVRITDADEYDLFAQLV